MRVTAVFAGWMTRPSPARIADHEIRSATEHEHLLVGGEQGCELGTVVNRSNRFAMPPMPSVVSGPIGTAFTLRPVPAHAGFPAYLVRAGFTARPSRSILERAHGYARLEINR